ncbi:protein of unknown function DUF1223 [Methylobacterium sp. 4-46]|uniref:DUF1223 domain-containing protein n=1 Tax=unclassified Methylobacterium TaxID=2615210 RepID=UPI000152D172|nr:MULTISPECIES: DUF1223 domain-containing protein [Methylobacterium]ACA19191.1 protein of unknown function DUF1223 [Methylobacterium sp. 4-46]WFT78399.1 DUF1223 domain-containing protein [Methylobacterium nodulans]
MTRAAVLRWLLPALLLTGAPPAGAGEEPRAVIELFTSQGCSACPPADRIIGDLSRDPSVIALSLPVTYWDYLGWKDTLAHAAFTERQRAYAGVRGDRQVYTPQAVINGASAVVGSDRSALEHTIRDPGTAVSLPVPIRSVVEDDRIRIEVGAAPDAGRTAELWLLPVSRSREVAIARGENRGKTVTYRNVVRGMHHVGHWTGAPARYEVPRGLLQASGDADSYVLVLQAEYGGPGRILGAAKGPGL